MCLKDGFKEDFDILFSSLLCMDSGYSDSHPEDPKPV